MTEISKVKLPDGQVYDIKDTVARNEISNIQDRLTTGMKYLGVTTTEITDGATTSSVIIDEKSVTAQKGDIVIYQELEFIYNGLKWQELGDPTAKGLGDLAYKDTATTSYTPSGSVSAPTFTGKSTILSSAITPVGSVSEPIFTGTQETISSSFIPAGSIAISTGSSGTVNYTPSGIVSNPTITVTPVTTTVNSITTVGTLPTCTLPTLETTVANETLELNWTEGAFNAGTLPTKGSNTTVMTSATATSSTPTFTGTGTVLNASFTGSAGTATATYTPTGNVSQPTFTGTETNISIDYTPTGTISKPTFSGSSSTITVS